MAVKIFVSYAYRDKILVDDLRRHLLPLQRQGLIEIWQDSEIAPGGEWNQVINKYLDTADIILLMLSPDFLNSDYCYSTEMQKALERDARREARVIPIILRPVHWQDAPFNKLQVLPTNAKPVTTWPNRDGAFYNITKGITHVIEDMHFREVESIKTYSPQKIVLSAPRAKRASVSRRTILIGGLGIAVGLVGTGLTVLLNINTREQNALPGPALSLVEHPIVYQVDWSKGIDGWNNSSGSVGMQIWTSRDGMLICDGTLAGEPSRLSIVAPYQPQNADYAVETDLQLLSITPNTAPAYFGLIARRPPNGPGTVGYVAGMSETGNTTIDKVFWQTSDQKTTQGQIYQPDHGWHTYRLEIKNHSITFFIDNHKVIAAQDTTFAESGLVGLVASACSLKVRNFKVIGL